MKIKKEIGTIIKYNNETFINNNLNNLTIIKEIKNDINNNSKKQRFINKTYFIQNENQINKNIFLIN
jgi:hypothetical protein